MIYYLTLIATILILYRLMIIDSFSSLSQQFPAELVTIKIDKNRQTYCFIISILMIILVGLRHESIGIDTEAYSSFYHNSKYVESFSQFIVEYERERGYYLCNWLFSGLDLSFIWFQIFCATLSIAPFAYIIYKYSKNACLSFLFYFFYEYYTFCFSGMRQAIAMGICAVAFHFLIKRKLFLFLIMVILASTFHNSALIFLPIIIYHFIPHNKITFALFMGTGLTVITFGKEMMMELIVDTERFANYLNSDLEVGGDRMAAFLILNVLFAYILWLYPRKDDRTNKIIFYTYVSGFFIFILSKIDPAALRMPWYFTIYMILFIPNFLAYQKKNLLYFSIVSIYLLIGLWFWQRLIMEPSMKLLPYHFFFENI